MKKNKFLQIAVGLAFCLTSCTTPLLNHSTVNSSSKIYDQSKFGTVTVNLDGFSAKTDKFKVQGVGFSDVSITQLKIDIVGLGVTTPVSQTISWTPGKSASFNLSVLAGTNRIIVLSALDKNGNIVSSLMGALNVVAGQNNVGKVSYFETSVAQVMYNILNSSKSSLLSTLKLDDVRTYVKNVTGYDDTTNKFSKISPLKVDTTLVSSQIQQSNGTLPSTSLANLETTGTLNLKLNLIGAKVYLNDLSSVAVTTTAYNTTISNITPGRWTLTVFKDGYKPSKMDINVSSTAITQSTNLATGSGRGGGGSTAGKDETGDLGIEKPLNNPTGAKTLFAIYLLGSDLEDDVLEPKGTADEVTKGGIVTNGAGSDDLRELVASLKAMTPAQRANIDVFVGFGGARKQGWKGIKYTNADCMIKDSSDNYFGNDSCYSYSNADVSMGKGQTLTDFVTYVRDTFPATNYKNRTMVLWDHGGAHLGYGPDTNTNEAMTLKEINDAFKADPIKYDMVGFDTCLMGNLDVARFVKNHARYMLASEELEPGHGWQYTEVLNYIANNPNASVTDLGKFMVDSFIDSPDHKDTNGKTLSLVDLSQFGNVITALDSFSASASSSLDTLFPTILKSAKNSQLYGKSAKGEGFSLDLKNFLALMKGANASIDTTTLDTALNSYILKTKNDGTRKDSNGVAIFDINNKEHFQGSDYKLTRAASTGWFNFVNAYVTKGTSDTSKPAVEAAGAMTTQGFGLKANICDDGACYKIKNNTGIKDVKAIKTLKVGDNRFMSLGSEEAVTVADDTYRAPAWDGTVLMVDGDIVPVDYQQTNSKGNKIYISDGKYNGDDAVISFELDANNTIVDNWAVPYDSTDEGEIRMSKEQFRLKNGDVVQFYYNVIDTEQDSDDEWDLGQEVTLGNATFSFGKADGELYTFLVAETMKGEIQNTPSVLVKTN